MCCQAVEILQCAKSENNKLTFIFKIQRLFNFPKQQILNSSKLKDFENDNFRFDGSDWKLSKQVENTVGKGEIASKRLLLQTSISQALFGKGLNNSEEKPFLKHVGVIL